MPECAECGGPLGDADNLICVDCMLEIIQKSNEHFFSPEVNLPQGDFKAQAKADE